MSPWRTLQCLSPARSSRARASASMSSERSRPSPRSIVGAEQLEHAAGAGAEIEQRAHRRVRERRRDRRLDRLVGDMQLADAVPLDGVAAEIGLRGGGARRRARRRAARGRAPGSGRRGRAARSARGRASAPPPRSPSRKKAQEPSRKRSTRPASASSLRWREMRGCDWRRISVRSETVSSASPSSARMRSRVASPAALSAPLSDVESQVGSGGHGVGHVPVLARWRRFSPAHKDIFIRLSGRHQGRWAEQCHSGRVASSESMRVNGRPTRLTESAQAPKSTDARMTASAETARQDAIR